MSLCRVPVAIAAMLTAANLALPCGVCAAALQTLYGFCGQGGTSCSDGAVPFGLIRDASGRLYGATQNGGLNNAACPGSSGFPPGCGVVFELTRNAVTQRWTQAVLYSFCAASGTSCPDGKHPGAGLIIGPTGHLYGTTIDGGAYDTGAGGGGTVFELTPNAARTKWRQVVLYSFCRQDGCRDGAFPLAGLVMDAAGRLYGTTFAGGARGGGTVFELVPNRTGTNWSPRVLHSFCTVGGKRCFDGKNPQAGVIVDAAGHLYGTTMAGGAHAFGTVFELAPDATRTRWTQVVLYSFCAQHDCSDGAEPVAGLIRDAGGRLHGTTRGGGLSGLGTVFELVPAAATTTESVLLSFGPDGAGPLGLIRDAAGHLYGTTGSGGAEGWGTAFELIPNADQTAWSENVLYSFCTQDVPNCTDGARPAAGLIRDAAGHLYGTTAAGGPHGVPPGGGGTVFELP
jgi:uncharacterized repeat protein (TIGR03803 family)